MDRLKIYSLDVDYEMDQNNSLNLYLNYENTNQQFKKFTSASGPFSYLGIYNVDRKVPGLLITDRMITVIIC